MASLSPLLSSSLSPYPQRKNQASNPRNKRHVRINNYLPCRASNNGDHHQTPMNSNNNPPPSKLDRRDLMFGLAGGLYGATTLGGERSALADPISLDVRHCEPATITSDEKVNCCLPNYSIHHNHIIDFVPPAVNKTLRVRPAIHLMTQEQLAKLEEAVAKMKELDDNDPRSFYQQAKTHCAYCNNAYKQDGFPKVDFEVHWNWLFLPFHRCYLYFHERILGSLINDPDFAIPFWNWDANIPSAMQMPTIYNAENSPLYDHLRDPNHRPPKLLDLNYDGITEYPFYDVMDSNLCLMYRQMVINGKTAEGFHGKPILAGDEATKTGMGSLENSPHNNIHDWLGDPNNKHREDMGNFYSAARDPLFYCHHANTDRLWTIWKGLARDDFRDPDWLNTSFVFYDENKNAIRIKVGDCLDNEKQLGYSYQDVQIPWLASRPIPLQKTTTRQQQLKSAAPPLLLPRCLDSKIRKEVKRVKKSRSEKEKSEEDEVLVIEMELDTSSRVHFNVLVNVVDDGFGLDVCPGNTEFAGSFRSLPHGRHGQFIRNTSLSLVITELIEELGYDDEESVFVTIDPKLGGDDVTIRDIKIELRPIN